MIPSLSKASRFWVLAAALSFARTEQDETTAFSVRRDVRESDGTSVKIYSDGHSLLTIYYNEKSRIVDCAYLNEKIASEAVNWLFYEALTGQTAGNNTAYFADVKRIYRKCKRQLREALDTASLEEHKEVNIRRQLKDGFDGAPLCNFHENDYENAANHSAAGASRLNGEELCCRTLRNCSVQIPGFKRRYNRFNYYSNPVFACNCTTAFGRCLQEVATPLAKSILSSYVDSGAVKCLVLEEKRAKCLQYDDWYANCVNITSDVYASFQRPTPPPDSSSFVKTFTDEHSEVVKDRSTTLTGRDPRNAEL